MRVQSNTGNNSKKMKAPIKKLRSSGRFPTRESKTEIKDRVIFVNSILDLVIKCAAISIFAGVIVARVYLTEMGFKFLFPSIISSQGGLMAIVFGLGLNIFGLCLILSAPPWMGWRIRQDAIRAGVSDRLFTGMALLIPFVIAPGALLVYLVWSEKASSEMGFLIQVIVVITWFFTDKKSFVQIGSLINLKEKTKTAIRKIKNIFLRGSAVKSNYSLTSAERIYAAAFFSGATANISREIPNASVACLVWNEVKVGINNALQAIRALFWSKEQFNTFMMIVVTIGTVWFTSFVTLIPWLIVFKIIHAEVLSVADHSKSELIETLWMLPWLLFYGIVCSRIAVSTDNIKTNNKTMSGTLRIGIGAIFLITALLVNVPKPFIDAAIYAAAMRENPEEAHWYVLDAALYKKLMPRDKTLKAEQFTEANQAYICAYSPFMYVDRKVLCDPSVARPNSTQCISVTESEARVVIPPTKDSALCGKKVQVKTRSRDS